MQRNILLAAAAATILSIAACNNSAPANGAASSEDQATASAEAGSSAMLPETTNQTAATAFVAQAASSDMFEIAAAHLALTRSQNTAVKNFARKMIADHTKSTAALKAAIAKSGQTIALPDAVPPDLQGKLDDLTKASAADFDTNYMDGQIDAHQNMLSTLQSYAQTGDVPELKSFAASTATVVQQHLDLAKKVRAGLKT